MTKHLPLLMLSGLLAQGMHAQTRLLTERVTVVAFDPATQALTVDAVHPDADDLNAFTVTPATVITDKRGNALTAADLRAGTGLQASWNEENYVRHLLSLQVTQPWASAAIKGTGLIEHVDPATGVAVVGGERIALEPGAVVAGRGGLKGEWAGFGDLTLGNTVEFEGVRDADGTVRVTKATVMPNKVDKGWRKVLEHLDEQFSYRYIVWNGTLVAGKGEGLFGSGHAEFNNARQSLVNDPELQEYVNNVGRRVVPDWQLNMPAQAPQRTDFRFMVVDNENFSLYSLPNGMVFISTGALARIHNEAQLAALLAREVAHVTCRHAQERNELMQNLHAAVKAAIITDMIRRGKNPVKNPPDAVLVDIIAMLAFQGAQGDWKAAGEQSLRFLPLVTALPEKTKKDLLSVLYNLRGVASPVFGAAAEAEADRIALFYMMRAGYDPRQAAQAYQPFVKLTMGDGMQVLHRSWASYLEGPKPFHGPNTLKDIGEVLLAEVVRAAADNWLGDRARSRSRFASMNLLVATGYGTMDLSHTKDGADAYARMRGLAQALIGGTD